jgi:hypothetical protein
VSQLKWFPKSGAWPFPSLSNRTPTAGARETQRIAAAGPVGEVGHHHVAPRPAAVPAVEGDHLVGVVGVDDVGVLAAEAAGEAVGVEAERMWSR